MSFDMNLAIYRSFLMFSFLAAFGTSARGEALRYRWPQSELVAYRVDIKIETPSAHESLKGTITYKLKQSGTEASTVVFSGGLTKATKTKASSQPSRGRFGGPPMRRGPGGPRGLSSNPFRGLERTTSQLVIDGTGDAQKLSGSSQLPWLLGNLSLLVFEPLPEEDKREWTVNSGATITEKKDDPRSRFGPRGPFGSQNNDEKKTAATTVTSFALESESDTRAEFNKNYTFDAPDDDNKVRVEGSGTWTFNKELGTSESLDFKQTYTVNVDNATIKIPMTIKYERMSAEEYRTLENNRQTAARNRPYLQGGYLRPTNLFVTKDMILPKDLLIMWRKDSKGNYWPARVLENMPDGKVNMKEIGYKKRTMAYTRGNLQLPPREITQPDSIPADVLDRLWAQAEAAKEAHAALQEKYKTLAAELKSDPKAQIGGESRESLLTDLQVEEYPTVIVALRHIEEYEPRQDAELHKIVQSIAEEHPDAAVKRAAAAALPKVLTADSEKKEMLSADTIRTWADSTGRFKVEATFVRIDANIVTLKRKSDSKEMKIPLNRLSKEDQVVARELASQAEEDNPFK